MINIIGGSGFLGTRLAKLLAHSNTPFKIIDKVASTAYPGYVSLADMLSIDSLMGVISDGTVLINLAYDEVNAPGAKNLCEVAQNKGVQKIIFISSVAVYGFAPLGTDETGVINPYDDYGRSKAEAERVFKTWQAEAPDKRTLVIVRPTVLFGEQDRGNVYNLLKQIAIGRFMMISNGKNRKSMAYVENVAAFIIHTLSLSPGVHIFNYADKPDFTTNDLVSLVHKMMGKSENVGLHLPYMPCFIIGKFFDFASRATGKSFAMSSIRVKKFCANSVYETAVEKTGFIRPITLEDALARTIKYEFLEKIKTMDLIVPNKKHGGPAAPLGEK